MRRTATLVLAVLVASILAAAPPAGSAGPPGSLQVRSVGTTYSGSHSDAALVVAAGGTATYSVKVVNPGTSTADFRLRVTQTPAATVVLTTSTGLFAKPLVAGPDGYAITGVPALGVKVVTVKVTPPSSSPQQTFTGLVTLADTDGTVLDDVTLRTEIRAPAKGTTPYTLFVSAGGPAVGGDVSGQAVTGPALKKSAQTKFTVKLRNDGTAAGTVRLRVHAYQGCTAYWRVTVRDSVGRDISLDVSGGEYLVALAKGGTKSFTAIVQRYNTDVICQDMGAVVSTNVPGFPVVQKVSADIRVHPAVS